MQIFTREERLVIESRPYLHNCVIRVGGSYAYAPPNGAIPRLVHVMGRCYGSNGAPDHFLVNYVNENGVIGTHAQRALGWFKSARIFPSTRLRKCRTINAAGRAWKKLMFKITEQVA